MGVMLGLGWNKHLAIYYKELHRVYSSSMDIFVKELKTWANTNLLATKYKHTKFSQEKNKLTIVRMIARVKAI